MARALPIRRYFQTADIFCAPNTGKESFGIVLCEAMASGRPVVASDIPGFDSVVTSGNEGLLVPPKDVEAFYLALKKLVESPSLRFSMGESGLNSVKAYSWDNVTPKIVDCYVLVDQEKCQNLILLIVWQELH